MSQWNNSYNYNNQHHGPNTWDGDINRQYLNQAYYQNGQYNSSNQYVSFNEFLSQLQVPNITPTNAAEYSNVQYENYPTSQYSDVGNYQSGPSEQSPQLHYGYQTNTANLSNTVEQYEHTAKSTTAYNPVPQEQNGYSNEVVSKSRLTPTASEFIPKSALKSNDNVNSENKQETQKESFNAKETTNRQASASTSSNWRERPSSSHLNGQTSYEQNSQSQINYKTNKNNDNNSKLEENGKNTPHNNYKKEYNQNNNYNSRNHRNKKSENGQSSDSNYHGSEYNNQKFSSNFRQKNKYNDTNRPAQDSNHYFESNDTGHPKSSSKFRNKQESDAGRTFYNSSMPKSNQDVRNNRNDNNGRGRWAGTQRIRPSDYSNAEHEEFANTYIPYKEDKREARDSKFSPNKAKGKSSTPFSYESKELTQRDRLTEQLDKGTLECLVCCERVKQLDSVWCCCNCYHVLHLRCIRKWAISSLVEGKWRCPACQNTNQDIPTEYRCMCGAVRNPEYQKGSSGAHTCGRSCKRPRSCPHPCTLLCHPGPCPPCQATVNKQCGCGAETRSVLCSSKLSQVCGRICQRKLECKIHTCDKECHEGPCEDCKETVTQVCYCPAASGRVVPCTGTTGSQREWSCDSECGRVLTCGAHVCRKRCHAPPCAPCPLRPQNVPTCPCGKTRLRPDQRKSCTDPIPLCDNICNKPLPCGPAGDRHYCKQMCHEGPCNVCSDKTAVQCRCRHSSREVPCADLPQTIDNVFCQRKCNKKMSCGRHKCRSVCCDAQTHPCLLVCGRSLTCQQHRCEDFCHTGHCAPCPIVSFQELRCSCGREVVLPPVRCGTRAPACSAPCRIARDCGHEPHHTCHSGDCPPCVVLTSKMCYGRHEERKTIPCSQAEFSCGMPCGKPLPCGKHTCIKTCHQGSCDAAKCTQPCREKRPQCGHECSAVCHSSGDRSCPSGALCRRPVRATCSCGRRTAERACCDNARDYAKLMSTLAASKMQEGGTVDLSEVQRPGSVLKTLECDEECYMEARSRRMALALQIRNPDVSAKLAPRYSEHVRATATREPAFAQLVHDRLTDLVQLAKKSKQKTRAHSFPSMNRQKRQFIHEMCEHFGCESVAYDAEPNRNVVATADREKSWLPAMSVLEVLGREAGRRRVPGPVLRAPPAPSPVAATSFASTQSTVNKSTSGWATLTSTNAWAARSKPKQEAKIDYFDNPPN